MKKPLLIITLGAPGSGKTYFSERLAKELDTFHLSGDRLRLKMIEKPLYTREEHNKVYSFADYLAKEFLSHGVSVVYDANFNFKKTRQRIQRLAKSLDVDCVLVWIKASEDVCLKRIKQRSSLKQSSKKEIYRPISKKIFAELRAEIETPTKSEKSVIEIGGHLPFKDQLKVFKKELKKII